MQFSEKVSTKAHWEKYWKDSEDIDTVYSNEERIYHNLKNITQFENIKILEVGAGSGRDSFQLAKEKAHVYVLDYSPQAMHIVHKINADAENKVNLIQADAFKIPVPDNTFDIVFHQGLLEHFKDPMPLIQENYRVLKPGGYLLIDVPQRYHVYTLIKHILIMFNKWFAGWETEFSINELKAIFVKSGFSVEYQYGRWMRPSFFYRVLREILKKLKIAMLPLYPKGFKLTSSLRDSLKKRFSNSNWAYYTFLDIGVIGQKQNSQSE